MLNELVHTLEAKIMDDFRCFRLNWQVRGNFFFNPELSNTLRVLDHFFSESIPNITLFGRYYQRLTPFCFADALVAMEKAMKRDKIEVNDRQVCFNTAILFHFDVFLLQ